jgi:hypothetical protein
LLSHGSIVLGEMCSKFTREGIDLVRSQEYFPLVHRIAPILWGSIA